MKWLKFSNNITFSADVKNSGEYNILDTMKTLPVLDVKKTVRGLDRKGIPIGMEVYAILSELPKSIPAKQKDIIFLANLTAELAFTEWLKYKSTFGHDAKFWYEDNWTPAYDWKPTPTEESSRYKIDNKSLTYLWDNYSLFNHTFAEKHRVELMANCLLNGTFMTI